MTPAEHRDQAAQMLTDVETTEAPSEARVLTQSAIAHALLGLLEIQIGSAQPITIHAVPKSQPAKGIENGSD